MSRSPTETDSYQEGFAFLKEALGDKVDQVKASTKLKTHPVCLSSGQGITFEMEKYFTAVQPELGMKAKRILEINVDHPRFAAFETARIIDPDKAKKYAEILYNQACLIAGLPIENPSRLHGPGLLPLEVTIKNKPSPTGEGLFLWLFCYAKA